MTKSTARSLLKSVVTTPAPVAKIPSAVSIETSAKVLLPLLRSKVFIATPGDAEAIPSGGGGSAPGSVVMYKSKSPSWS